MAEGGMSQEDIDQLVKTLNALKLQPKSDTPEDFLAWMQACIGKASSEVKVEPGGSDTTENAEVPLKHSTVVKVADVPRLPFFSGEASKDSSYDLWRYEVRCLFQDKLHSEDTVRQAIRRSLKGPAARALLRLGAHVDVNSILAKMDSVFGDVNTAETLLAKFYSAKQLDSESVASWALRLEDLLGQAVDAGEVQVGKTDQMLRSMLWTGLIPRLKDICGHKFDNSHTFSELLVSLRRTEQEVNSRSGSSQKKSTPVMAAVKAENKELEEIKGMIKKLTGEVAELKKKSDSPSQGPLSFPSRPPPGYLSGRGYAHPQGPPRQFRGPSIRFPSPTFQDSSNCVQGSSAQLQPATSIQAHSYQRPPVTQTPRMKPGWTTDTYGQPTPICYRCGQVGHLSYQCNVRTDHRWNSLN